jgi:putative ABC transport system permease protein
MKLTDTFHTALKGVTINPMRSLLTMLGIIIGVGSVVLMSSVGQSMEGVILSQISSLGPKSMVIFPGKQEGGAGAVSAGHDSLTFEDLRELEQLKSIESVAPVIFIPGRTVYGKEEGTPQVFGIVEKFFSNQNISAKEGRLLDKEDIDGAKAVAVLGSETAEKFFGSIDPLGKRIKVGNNHFTVVGVAKALGSQFFQNADERVYVPFTVARNVTGQKYLNYLTMKATGSFDLAFEDVKFLLRRRHGIDPLIDDEKKDDFVVRSSAQANEILGSVSLGLTMFITTIAAISLLVGGIGIMNIMLVSVTERTQEIGLRKALGAKKIDILLQFLVEAVVLTMIGGIIGQILGISFAFFVSILVKPFLSTYAFAISTSAIIVSFLMAAMTGMVFGLSPARRAAALQPIEALRYE